MRVLVTGATGYVGGRLVPRLLAAGHTVRCLVRDPTRLHGRPWTHQVDAVAGDVTDASTLAAALDGVQVAYYLVHSLGVGREFHRRDVDAARGFGGAARAAGVERLIYLGGLGDPAADLSEHLRSRQDTGAALRDAGVPVTEFRAAVVVGAGSVSFELIRYLTERLPVMICPRWVYTRIQPIAIRNVLDYLVAALDVPESAGEIVEIGGRSVLTYGEMMMRYAGQRKLRRRLIAVPLLTPRLSSYWVHLVTPIPATIARPLIDGLRNEVVVRDPAATRLFPGVRLLDYDEAVAAALARLDTGTVDSWWSDALSTSLGQVAPVVFTAQEGLLIERRQRVIAAPPGRVFNAFTALGGKTGWLFLNWTWRVRGGVDRLAGGVGMRRGRRHATEVRVGDALDFWRIEAVEPDRLLRLRAEMKVPGRAWLEFEVREHGDGRSLVSQTAYFAPQGLWGLVYWYALYPAHAVIFSGMIRRLAERAEAASGAGMGAARVPTPR